MDQLQLTINSVNLAKSCFIEAEHTFSRGTREEYVMNTEQVQLVLDWFDVLRLQCKNLTDYLTALKIE